MAMGASPEPELPEGCTAETAALWEVFARLWDEICDYQPVMSTIMGERRYNAEMGTLSKERRDDHVKSLRAMLKEAHAIQEGGGLPEEQVTNLEYLIGFLEAEVAFRENLPYEMPLNHMFGPHMFLFVSAKFMPLETREDCEALLSRARKFGTLMDEMIDALRDGVKSGRTLPVDSVQRIIGQIAGQIVDDPGKNLLFQVARGKFEAADVSVDELKVPLEEIVAPAVRRVHEFLSNEYLQHARKDAGVWSIPGGSEAYEAFMNYYTGLSLDPHDVHERGKQEVARVMAKIDDLRRSLGEDAGTLPEFASRVASRSENLPKDAEDIIARYEVLVTEAREQCAPLFDRVPAAPLEVVAVEPFRAPSTPAAHYIRAPTDRSRPAFFYANTYKPETRPLFAMRALALHEGIPGHHLQTAIAQELPALPRLRKQNQDFTTGFTEGWGLFCEYLGEEIGFYENPWDMYGRFTAELWRAARLVVDTGLHSERYAARTQQMAPRGEVPFVSNQIGHCWSHDTTSCHGSHRAVLEAISGVLPISGACQPPTSMSPYKPSVLAPYNKSTIRRWSREEAVTYMCNHTCLAYDEAVVEVDRYTVAPGQALAYRLGEQKLLELRQRAELDLKDRFTWKGFHNALLGNGAMPLGSIERHVDQWISQEAAKA